MKLLKALAYGVLTMAVAVAIAAVVGPESGHQAALVWPIGNSPTL
ncbi:hypothetical protein EV586_102468 [Tumebacillus sp. BK434]|nr:hypothetical protein [Tumebacillus sp. BK434]TCP58020.1 hypothetical protein EV586_102468 [Tumebacillus sp. BK434]